MAQNAEKSTQNEPKPKPENEDEPCVLRIDFPGRDAEGSLEEERKSGEERRISKFVSRETA